MPDPRQRSGPPPQGAASEISATAEQLDLTVESTGTVRHRPRTEPDPAVRRRNMEDGRRRADEGARAAVLDTPVGVVDVARRRIRELAESGEEWTAETLRERLRGHLLGAGDNALGAVIREAARQGLIVRVGVTSASRPEARGRLISVWRGRGEPCG